jgi:hypothetical protein
MRAYVLVNFEASADLAKAQHALDRPGVTSVDLVLGPYDAVVSLDVPDYRRLVELAKHVRGCPGIRNTVTCPALEG